MDPDLLASTDMSHGTDDQVSLPDLGFDFSTETLGVTDILALEDFAVTAGAVESGDRPYHTKRPHRKSRKGCKNCKTRKVKCDEARPRCRACTLRREDCVYFVSPPTSVASPSSHSAATTISRTQSPASQTTSTDFGTIILEEPIYTPGQTDALDMKLLWFYTTKGFDSFAVEAGRQPKIDEILQVKIPQYAFSSPFLMNSLLALSGLQMRQMKQDDVPQTRIVAYRARAFEGYRKAIEQARPEEFPALLACSLLLCALASEMFRDPDTKPLYIIDWMVVWRGIGLIMNIIKPQALFESGMSALFTRPPINLDTSAKYIPNNLLLMVSSIREDDDDFPHVSVYYDTLKYLGALYMELESGFGPILNLRVITWFTFLPKGFVELAQQKKPRALVVIAHYLTFVKLAQDLWWMEGIADKEIRNIYHFLGEKWHPVLRVPRNALYIEDRIELGKLILDNNTWDPEFKIGDNWDERTKLLKWVDDTGHPVHFDGQNVVRDGGEELARWNVAFMIPPTKANTAPKT